MNQSDFRNFLTPEAVRRFGLDRRDVVDAVAAAIHAKRALKASKSPEDQAAYDTALERARQLLDMHGLPYIGAS